MPPQAPTADAVLTPDVSFKIPVFTGDFRWSSINWATASNKPPELSNFPEQAVKLLCVDPQSSTRWRITPPMKANLSALLEDPTAIVTVDFGWQLSRNDNSAGECQAQTSSRLSPETVDRLRGILNGTLTRTELSAEVPGDTDTPSTDTSAGGLYALFWRIGGSPCEVDTDYKGIDLLYSRRDKARLDGLTQEGEETASSLPILRADQQVNGCVLAVVAM